MEIEAKFAVTDQAVAEQLKTIDTLGDFQFMAGKIKRVRDTYLDTRDRRLLAAGFVCRRRLQNRQIIITLKQITSANDAIHAREELEIVLPHNAPPAQWSNSPARDRILELIGDAPLKNLFALRQTRWQRNILKNDRIMAEWSVDDVCVTVGKASLQFSELEIELKNGAQDDLDQIVAIVKDEYKLAPQPQSKFERALAWVDEHRHSARKRTKKPSPTITLDDSMAEAARKTILLQWGKMIEQEQGARDGKDIEHIHDMRVATRRMRAALAVFADYLDAEAWKPFAKMLRRTARALGTVRDLDVFRDKAQNYIDQLPDERKSELDSLLSAWQTKHDHARQALIDLFDSDTFVRFKKEFDEFLKIPGAGAIDSFSEPVTAHRVRDVLPMILLGGYTDVRAYAESVDQPDVPLTRLHQLRIASKGLRYTLEFFTDILAPKSKKLIDHVKCLQEHLGNLQDAVVASQILRDFLTWGSWGDANQTDSRELIVAPGVAAYLAARQNEINGWVKTFGDVWSPIVSADFRRQLLALIAEW